MMIFLVMLRLEKEMYIRVVGLVWFAGSVPLVAAYIRHGILTPETGAASALACLPAFIGMFVGQRLRRRINQRTFRTVLMLFLLATGLNLLRRAFF